MMKIILELDKEPSTIQGATNPTQLKPTLSHQGDGTIHGTLKELTVAVLMLVFFKRCASSQMTSPKLMLLISSTDRKNIS